MVAYQRYSLFLQSRLKQSALEQGLITKKPKFECSCIKSLHLSDLKNGMQVA